MVFNDFSNFEPPKNDTKSIQKRVRKKTRKKTSKKSILAVILAAKTDPKSAKIAAESDAGRSLFRDAIHLANKPSEVSGAQTL